MSSCSPAGPRAALSVICLAFVLGACAASRVHMASAPMAAAPAGMPAPAPLQRSLFARDPGGALSEDALQAILASPIELELPARVGVLPVVTATDWRGPGPEFERVPAGLGSLVTRLRKDPSFSLVTEMMPIPSGALGMEALREAAARYRLRYLLLYREVMLRDATLNPWAWGYATIIGAAFLPGERLRARGYMEATMFDVKTGLLMFTTRRAVFASENSNAWSVDDKLATLEATATARFAPELGVDLIADLHRFAMAAVAENERRHAGATVTLGAAAPPGEAATIATDPAR